MNFPMPTAHPAELKLRPEALDRLCTVIQSHVDAGMHPGGQVAVARHGKLALFRTFGDARLSPEKVKATDDTLWRIYSNSKMITTSAIWLLAEQGALSFHDKVADHVPAFARHGKGEITILQLLTHRAGFPTAGMAEFPAAAYQDRELRHKAICDFTLEWTPGSQIRYHNASAHWTASMLIETLTGQDYRQFLREQIIEKLGLGRDIYIGLPEAENARAADVHMADAKGVPVRQPEENTPAYRAAGLPGSGGMATARGLAAFYMMMAQGGQLNGVRLVSPRMIQYVTKNFTADAIDIYHDLPMHRGIGAHSRGLTPKTNGLGSIAGPRTFGHGGVGTSYCWADPDTGVSFAFVSNSRLETEKNARRLELLSNIAHSAIEDAPPYESSFDPAG